MFEPEPPYKNNPLYDFDNVILSPHLAGVTPEAAIAAIAATLSAANHILQVLQGKSHLILLIQKFGTIFQTCNENHYIS